MMCEVKLGHPPQLFFKSVFYLKFSIGTVIKIEMKDLKKKIQRYDVLNATFKIIGIIFHSAETKRIKVMYMFISSNSVQISHPSAKYPAVQFQLCSLFAFYFNFKEQVNKITKKNSDTVHTKNEKKICFNSLMFKV